MYVYVKTEKRKWKWDRWMEGWRGYGVKGVVSSFCRQSDSTCSSETGCFFSIYIYNKWMNVIIYLYIGNGYYNYI